MIPLPVDELRDLGRLEATDDHVTGVKIDSRRVQPGDLFVADRGGVEYVGAGVAAHGLQSLQRFCRNPHRLALAHPPITIRGRGLFPELS